MNHWDIITGEYPPQIGGVADYTRGLALGLAEAGDRVHVWAPPCNGVETADQGVIVHRLPDHFRLRALKTLTKALAKQPEDGRILLQYVPHAFGCKAMNVPFCTWLLAKAPREVWVVYHEVAVDFNWNKSVKNNVLALVTRLMSLLVARAANRIWVTIPLWKSSLIQVAHPNTPIEFLPVPSNIPLVCDPDGVGSVRRAFLKQAPSLLGHFGTYRRESAPMLMDIIPALMRVCSSNFVLLGHNSVEFLDQLLSHHPHLSDRVSATGPLGLHDLSVHLTACDLMIQPYSDGVSARRTSIMACLAHGLPAITNNGAATEEYWLTKGAVNVIDLGPLATRFALAAHSLLVDTAARQRLGLCARRVYEERFSAQRLIGDIRGAMLSK
jgi:glycosyltransferase involved in cell wall biosynthesis